jgi:membrane-bound metal-dependent hydrolase YbcI (DUF457 family)
MLPPGHLLIPFAFADKMSANYQQRRLFITSTLFFSIFPDIDVFLVGGIAGHHQTLTHTPLFWLTVFFVLFLISTKTNKKSVKAVSLGLLAGSMAHMFLDTFGMSVGVAWLAPFSKQEFSFLPVNSEYATNDWLAHYLKSTAFWIEIVLVVSIGVYYLQKYIRKFSPQGY